MNKTISSMMTKQTVSVAMDDSIAQVESVLRDNNLSAVPVLERPNGAALGIISLSDLTRFHFEKKMPMRYMHGRYARISRSRSAQTPQQVKLPN